MILNKYRIITNGKRYRIQRRFLWIFWTSMTMDHPLSSWWYMEFDSLREARQRVAYMEKYGYNPRKWKVVNDKNSML